LSLFVTIYRIRLDKFTYTSTDMKDQLLSLLEEIYFEGISVS